MLLIFCLTPPLPYQDSLKQSPPWWRQIQVDFEVMAAKQNHCAETQRLLGGSSLQLAFHPAGTQCLAGDVSSGVFLPIVPKKFRKDIFSIFTTFHIPGGSSPGVWYLLLLFGEEWPATSPHGRGPASTASKPTSPHSPAPPASPHLPVTFFSPSHRFCGTLTV